MASSTSSAFISMGGTNPHSEARPPCIGAERSRWAFSSSLSSSSSSSSSSSLSSSSSPLSPSSWLVPPHSPPPRLTPHPANRTTFAFVITFTITGLRLSLGVGIRRPLPEYVPRVTLHVRAITQCLAQRGDVRYQPLHRESFRIDCPPSLSSSSSPLSPSSWLVGAPA